jgi:hypothetical protein
MFRMQDDDFRTAFDGDQLTHLPRMSLLPATLLLREMSAE